MEIEESEIKELKPADFGKNKDEYEENRKDNEEQIKVENIRPEIIISNIRNLTPWAVCLGEMCI